METEMTILISALLGAIIVALIYEMRKKIWYLETLNPRQHYVLGKEKRIIAHMNVAGRHFHGLEAGPYKVFLAWGDLGTFGKPVLEGKIEEAYTRVLAKSLYDHGFLRKIERLKFWTFLSKYIPALKVRAYMLTGELISPKELVDSLWRTEEKRTEALTELKQRGLFSPKVLWIKPYPPEEKLTEILTGVQMVPDIIMQHVESYNLLTKSQRDTLIDMDWKLASLLSDVISLMRDIVTSFSDPTHVFGMIISDRARKIRGLGLEQLAEKGGIESVINAAKAIKQYKDELVKVLEEEAKPEEIEKIRQKLQEIDTIKKKVEELEKTLPKPVVAEAK
ncbi:MAG: hypothetical protein NZ932_03960 [Candidatus Bathyarchaeota archaeon]|nr:hypothetical protein [Candidatus Bathyarchaeota archaeon]MDW8022376.1 hypothetical protein [Nitrososphaerota archaeon]